MGLSYSGNVIDWLTIDSSYGTFLQINILCSLAFMLLFVFFQFKYGKTYTPKRSLLKVDINDRIAVFLVYFPALFVYLLINIHFPNGDLLNICSFCYVSYYIYRAFIYIFFRSRFSKPWPLETLLYYSITNTLIAIILARFQIFSGRVHPKWLQLLTATLFYGFAIATFYFDTKICRLKTDNSYKIPRDSMFTLVSGPNYFFELLQWLAFALFMDWSFDTACFIFWINVNISSRAESTHEWYTKAFPKYPEGRTPYIPFVKNSKYFL